jgi:hypothetical protein
MQWHDRKLVETLVAQAELCEAYLSVHILKMKPFNLIGKPFFQICRVLTIDAGKLALVKNASLAVLPTPHCQAKAFTKSELEGMGDNGLAISLKTGAMVLCVSGALSASSFHTNMASGWTRKHWPSLNPQPTAFHYARFNSAGDMFTTGDMDNCADWETCRKLVKAIWIWTSGSEEVRQLAGSDPGS